MADDEHSIIPPVLTMNLIFWLIIIIWKIYKLWKKPTASLHTASSTPQENNGRHFHSSSVTNLSPYSEGLEVANQSSANLHGINPAASFSSDLDLPPSYSEAAKYPSVATVSSAQLASNTDTSIKTKSNSMNSLPDFFDLDLNSFANPVLSSQPPNSEQWLSLSAGQLSEVRINNLPDMPSTNAKHS